MQHAQADGDPCRASRIDRESCADQHGRQHRQAWIGVTHVLQRDQRQHQDAGGSECSDAGLPVEQGEQPGAGECDQQEAAATVIGTIVEMGMETHVPEQRRPEAGVPTVVKEIDGCEVGRLEPGIEQRQHRVSGQQEGLEIT
ncbi:hypothetical protein D3C81_1613470 [compost metagenome]